jgi:AcrR family transcriptional regulator
MFKTEVRAESETKSERTKRHLLDVSLKLFEERGFAECTMRDLARAADVTVSHFYYYFKSKEEIVASFYDKSLQAHLKEADKLIKEGQTWTRSLRMVIESRFAELAPYRTTLIALTTSSFDRANPVSPFHSSHLETRKSSIELFLKLIRGSRLRVLPQSQRELAYLFWLYHLAVVLYWIKDDSKAQEKTHELLDRSLKHLEAALFLARLPGAQRAFKSVIDTLKCANILETL